MAAGLLASGAFLLLAARGALRTVAYPPRRVIVRPRANLKDGAR